MLQLFMIPTFLIHTLLGEVKLLLLSSGIHLLFLVLWVLLLGILVHFLAVFTAIHRDSIGNSRFSEVLYNAFK